MNAADDNERDDYRCLRCGNITTCRRVGRQFLCYFCAPLYPRKRARRVLIERDPQQQLDLPL